MLRPQLAIAIISLFSASVQAATLSFNVDGDRLKTAGGNGVPTGSLILLIASLTNGSFSSILEGGSTALGSSGSFLAGDDIVLFRASASLTGSAGFATGGIEQSLFPNWSLSDPLALVWFPTLTLASPFSLTANTPYGIYTNSSAIDETSPWITPSAPASAYALAFYTTDGLELGPGSNSPSSGNANQIVTAAPEPTSAALLMVGLLSFASRRRRQAI